MKESRNPGKVAQTDRVELGISSVLRKESAKTVNLFCSKESMGAVQ